MSAAVNDTTIPDRDGQIASALLARGRLKEGDLGRARRLLEESGGSVAALLVRLGLVSERDMAEAAAEAFGLPLLAAKDCPDVPPPNVHLSARFLKQHAVCPVGEGEDRRASSIQIDNLIPVPILLLGYANSAPRAARSSRSTDRWHRRSSAQ